MRFRPCLEGLESRAVPTVLSGEIHVNTLTTGSQNHSDTATNALGRTVTVWVRDYGAYQHIRAQQFNLAGQKVGSEIFVASTAVHRANPHVAVSNAGAIVVTWEEAATVKAQRLNANGVLLGVPIAMNLSGKFEEQPDVALANNGSFVVTYTGIVPPFYVGEVRKAQAIVSMFRANGSPLRTFYVNSNAATFCTTSVAAAPDGRFAVAYSSFLTDPNYPDPLPAEHFAYMRRYSAAGTLLSSHSIGTNKASIDMNPHVAMDNAGNTVVVFHDSAPQVRVYPSGEYVNGTDFGIREVRISSVGVQAAPVNLVAGGSTLYDAAIDRTNGSFVVVIGTMVAGNQKQLSVAEFNAAGALRKSTSLGLARFDASVGVSDSHYFFISFTMANHSGDPLDGIFARRGIISLA